MTPENFCYWLQGFMEVQAPTNLNEQQIAVIQEHLNLVFNKVTKTYVIPVKGKAEDIDLSEIIEKFKKDVSIEGLFPKQPNELICASSEPATVTRKHFSDVISPQPVYTDLEPKRSEFDEATGELNFLKNECKPYQKEYWFCSNDKSAVESINEDVEIPEHIRKAANTPGLDLVPKISVEGPITIYEDKYITEYEDIKYCNISDFEKVIKLGNEKLQNDDNCAVNILNNEQLKELSDLDIELQKALKNFIEQDPNDLTKRMSNSENFRYTRRLC